MIKIDKGVPIPPHGNAGSKKYPILSMEVGDSFFAPGKKPTANMAMSKARKTLGYRFSQRAVVENGVAGVRVWRVE